MDDFARHINFLRISISKTLSVFESKDLNPTQLFAIGLLDRLYCSSFSFELQLDSYRKFKELDFSISLTLRALLLDALIAFNLYKIISDLETSGRSSIEIKSLSDEYCNKVLADGINQSIKFFSSARNYNLIDDSTLKNAFNEIGARYQGYLDKHIKDGTQPKVKFGKPLSNPELFKTLAKDTDLTYLSQLYNAYSYYSKYDHFGILYFELASKDLTIKLEHFSKCIAIFLKHYLNLLSILDQFGPEHKGIIEQFNIAADYLRNNS